MKLVVVLATIITALLLTTGAWADALIAALVTFALAQQLWRTTWRTYAEMDDDRP